MKVIEELAQRHKKLSSEINSLPRYVHVTGVLDPNYSDMTIKIEYDLHKGAVDLRINHEQDYDYDRIAEFTLSKEEACLLAKALVAMFSIPREELDEGIPRHMKVTDEHGREMIAWQQ